MRIYMLVVFLALSWSLAQASGGSTAVPATSSVDSAAQSSNSTPVFRSTTRLVTVDVIVTDASGQPVTDLKSSDFTLSEDGKPQHIRFFDVHTSAKQKPANPPIQLPPNQYTNFPDYDSGGAMNVVLMDMLNTTGQDQAYARRQMLDFLKTLPPHQRVALFTLGTNLTMLQPFTGNSDALVAAASKLLAHTSPMLTSEVEHAREQDRILYESRMSLPASTGPASGAPSGSGGESINASSSDMTVALVSGLQRALAVQESFQEDSRARTTLAALSTMARSLAGYAGRKNLIWLSGGFPFRLGPDFTNDPAFNVGNYGRAIQETAALLAASQVAVYPIDVRGMTHVGIDISSTGEEKFSNVQSRQSNELWETHSTMTDIAQQTGGHAFYGTNDVKAAISSSFEHAANYYTLAYAPENHEWNSKYRKLEVKVPVKGLKLNYRRGYYAKQDQQAQGDKASRLLAGAMMPSLPQATMLLLKVQVLPPDREHPVVRIDYAVDAHDLGFNDTSGNGKHVVVDFIAVVWDKDGHDAGHVADTVDATFKPDAYSGILRTGFPAHQELTLKPGSYHLRLGVIDRGTQKIGTLDVPLAIAETSSTSSH